MSKKLPRGIRNNNPGNIRRTLDKWQGLTEKQTDTAFFTFTDATYGIRAIARLLITYQDKHGIRTIYKAIARYAPPGENKTQRYIDFVAAQTGFDAKAPLDFHSFEDLEPVVKAIIRFENGPGDWYSQAQITKGLVLAGVEPPKGDLKNTRTVKAGRVATAATVATPLVDNLEQIAPAVPLLQTVAEYAPWVLALIALAAIGYIIYARVDDRNKGLR